MYIMYMNINPIKDLVDVFVTIQHEKKIFLSLLYKAKLIEWYVFNL